MQAKLLGLVLGALLFAAVPAREARASLADRVVAVVAERPIVASARAGVSFCQLVAQHNGGSATSCGSHGPTPLASLLPELQAAASTLKAGETSDPILLRGPGGSDALVIMQLGPVPTPAIPFEEVEPLMKERAALTVADRARREWLRDLRRRAGVEVRL